MSIPELQAIYYVARPNQPCQKIQGNGGQTVNYRQIVDKIAKDLEINRDCLHTQILDPEKRTWKQDLQSITSTPDYQFFQFLLSYCEEGKQEEIWTIYVEQVPEETWKHITTTLHTQQDLFVNIPDEYKQCFIDLFPSVIPRINSKGNCTANREISLPVFTKAGKQYQNPFGWYGVGIHVDKQREKEVFKTWHVCFHCSSAPAINSIVEHNTLVVPGSTLKDGTVLKIPNNHIPDENFVFGSPCLDYCNEGYGRQYVWRGKIVSVALQLRFHSNGYIVQGNTLRNPSSHLPYFPNDKIEWKAKDQHDVVVTRVLMKIDNFTANTQLMSSMF